MRRWRYGRKWPKSNRWKNRNFSLFWDTFFFTISKNFVNIDARAMCRRLKITDEGFFMIPTTNRNFRDPKILLFLGINFEFHHFTYVKRWWCSWFWCWDSFRWWRWRGWGWNWWRFFNWLRCWCSWWWTWWRTWRWRGAWWRSRNWNWWRFSW